MVDGQTPLLAVSAGGIGPLLAVSAGVGSVVLIENNQKHRFPENDEF